MFLDCSLFYIYQIQPEFGVCGEVIACGRMSVRLNRRQKFSGIGNKNAPQPVENLVAVRPGDGMVDDENRVTYRIGTLLRMSRRGALGLNLTRLKVTNRGYSSAGGGATAGQARADCEES